MVALANRCALMAIVLLKSRVSWLSSHGQSRADWDEAIATSHHHHRHYGSTGNLPRRTCTWECTYSTSRYTHSHPCIHSRAACCTPKIQSATTICTINISATYLALKQTLAFLVSVVVGLNLDILSLAAEGVLALSGLVVVLLLMVSPVRHAPGQDEAIANQRHGMIATQNLPRRTCKSGCTCDTCR
jgi:hypothetical protein